MKKKYQNPHSEPISFCFEGHILDSGSSSQINVDHGDISDGSEIQTGRYKWNSVDWTSQKDETE